MYQAAVYQTGRLMEWCRVSKGVGRWGRGGKRGSRVTNWAQMSMTISCTWAGQSTDQTTLGITRSVCMSVVYDYTDGGMERTWKGCPDVSEWQPAPIFQVDNVCVLRHQRILLCHRHVFKQSVIQRSVLRRQKPEQSSIRSDVISDTVDI